MEYGQKICGSWVDDRNVGYSDVLEVAENDIVFLLWEMMADLLLTKMFFRSHSS